MEKREVVRRGKRKPKRSINPVILFQWVVIFGLIIALICVSCGKGDGDGQKTKVPTSSTAALSSDVSSLQQETKPDSSEADQWYLRLVNAEVKVSEADISSVKCKTVNSKYTNRELSFDERAVEALEQMCEAALSDGVKLTIGSGYRTYAYQANLYKNKVAVYTNKGYSEEDAKQTAATIVARPGTSEHNLGLAIDFTPIDDSFEKTNQYKWLKQNAAKYGFVQRYQKAKSDITGIVNESWHYRYVTPTHAELMTELDMCLEEYVDYLKK